MLHGPLHDCLIRTAAAVFAFATLLLAAPGVEAIRADDALVTVTSPGGSELTLSLAALAGGEDVVERGYALGSSAGQSSTVVTGFSLSAILDAAGADPYGFSYLEVQRPAGGSVLLSRHQALDPEAFADGPPVLYATGTGTGFLRPSSGPGDFNATDSFVAPQGVALVLHTDAPLLVEIESSTVRTRPGQPVEFEAIVERAGSGERLSYSWYFDDGHSANGAHARHGFAKRGSYDVVVGVTTPGDRAGASAVVTIQVGAPLSGPDRRGGGRNRDAGAPDHGAATGTRGTVPPGPDASLSAAGEPVVGELVSAVVPVDEKKSVAARRGQLENDGAGAGLPDVALGLIVTAALLGAGVLAESRGALLSLSDQRAPRGGMR